MQIFSKWRAWFGAARFSAPAVPVVILYTRQHCHLCNEAKQLLEELQREEHFEIRAIDIDTDPKLRAEFTNDVPVVYIDGSKAFKHRIDTRKFLKSLRARKGTTG